MSRTYSFKQVQILPVTPAVAWQFFSDPANLARITPPDLGFRVISLYHGNHIYPGQLIEYKVSPVAGISLYWMTEITHVKELEYFVDEQRYGPYSLWHHQHHFREVHQGVEMTDIVHYRIPFSFLGDIANSLFVKRRLQHIFEYRRKITETIFQ